MASTRGVRGSGVRLTLPYVLRFSGLWLIVTMSIVLVFSVASYLLILGRKDVSHEHLTVVLAAQTVLTLLALFGLAVFTTHRLAGPLIALRRALDEVKAGNLDKGLHFRRSDPHLHELETSFNEMLAALRERSGMDRSASAGG